VTTNLPESVGQLGARSRSQPTGNRRRRVARTASSAFPGKVTLTRHASADNADCHALARDAQAAFAVPTGAEFSDADGTTAKHHQ
jgi:hypothetical protein